MSVAVTPVIAVTAAAVDIAPTWVAAAANPVFSAAFLPYAVMVMSLQSPLIGFEPVGAADRPFS
jgi:hypothetical protein